MFLETGGIYSDIRGCDDAAELFITNRFLPYEHKVAAYKCQNFPLRSTTAKQLHPKIVFTCSAANAHCIGFFFCFHRAGQRNHSCSPGHARAQEHLGLPVQWRAFHRGSHRRVVDRARWRHADAAALPSATAQGTEEQPVVENRIRFKLLTHYTSTFKKFNLRFKYSDLLCFCISKQISRKQLQSC